MQRYLTIPEAVQMSGKSESTLKRLVRGIRDNPGHPERVNLLPTYDEYEVMTRNREPFSWRISEDFLRRKFNGSRREGSASSSKIEIPAEWSELIKELREAKDTYREQLAIKDEQLKQITQLAVTQGNALHEQMKSAVLEIQRMNTQLKLSEAGVTAAARKAAEKGSAEVQKKETEQASKSEASPTKETPKPTKASVKQIKKKRGLFARMFG